MEKSVEFWTRKELESLPLRGWNENIGLFDSLVILPTRQLHDSGFRKMYFVAVKNNIPFSKMSGHSDVIHLDGIGGYGRDWFKKTGSIPDNTPVKSWMIDSLRKSGLLRIFCTSHTLSVGEDLSSFELFTDKMDSKITK